MLIILGILIAGTVTYINYKTTKINQEFVNQYKEINKNIETINNEYKNGDVIGVLNIPKINLEVEIKRGIINEIIKIQ